MNEYERDRKWAMQFDDHVQLIIIKALRVIRVALALDDMRHNADFQLIYHPEPLSAGSIAGRVRRREYLGPYGNQITFRYSRPSGVDVEWQKMLAGYGDWMVYGFAADDKGDRLCAWVMLNLQIFRQHVSGRHTNLGAAVMAGKNPHPIFNDDGTRGIAWPLSDIALCGSCLGALIDSSGHDGLWAIYRRAKEISDQVSAAHAAIPQDKRVVLDWRSGHETRKWRRCVYCKNPQPTNLIDDAGQPAHKMCVEIALAAS